MCFQNMINLAGRPKKVPKLRTGAVFVTPSVQFNIGTSTKEPPPPDMVDSINAAMPRIRSKPTIPKSTVAKKELKISKFIVFLIVLKIEINRPIFTAFDNRKKAFHNA